MKALLVGQSDHIELVFRDPDGNIITPSLAGQPIWSLSNFQPVTFQPAPDGMSADLTAIAAGQTTLTVEYTIANGQGQQQQIVQQYNVTSPAASLVDDIS